ncbi:MAG: flagellar biosynthesis protein FlhB [Erysipelotrichaceae bacterium]|nr:flagellar biosynthesis protein FlhB [Erysipelotrichaceae bacterium]
MLQLNLQLFAKEGPGGEKTEPATEKKLSDARKEGQVAKSKELGQALSLLALFIVLKIWAGSIGRDFLNGFRTNYNRMKEMTTLVGGEISIKDFCRLMNGNIASMAVIVLPIFAAAFFIAFLSDIVQVKWEPTAKPLQPKFSKINPINGFKRMFSKEKLIDLLKALLKIALLGYLAYSTLKGQFAVLFSLFDMELISAIGIIGDIAINLGLKISAFYIVIGFADYGYQKWKFAEDMKMTKQEVKDEWKNAEGDPAVKSKQKQRMMEASRRRMMQAVPSADVVITNPTHFAVAIKYDVSVFDAPFVVAKGEDFLAARIKERAAEAGVEIVENKPLARILYYNVDLGNPIPPELYQTVAEILAAIYNARAAG